jgi:predicted oxidoreductase
MWQTATLFGSILLAAATHVISREQTTHNKSRVWAYREGIKNVSPSPGTGIELICGQGLLVKRIFM